MAIFEQIYISKYKKILKQIENLNKRNKKGLLDNGFLSKKELSLRKKLL